jgi:NhaP-type Na+/H+ or K+/H+ antiporter
MPESNKTTIELGIEFVVELLLFLYPYGAEQMNLPHNFWLGLGCWVIGTAIAIRMFWIFPVWTHRLTRLEKGLIAFILVGVTCSPRSAQS